MSDSIIAPPYDSTVEQLYYAASDVEMQVRHNGLIDSMGS